MIEATDKQLIAALNLIGEYVEGRLPDGYRIEISVTTDECWMNLFSPAGDEIEVQTERSVSAINSAIEAAIENDAEEAGEA